MGFSLTFFVFGHVAVMFFCCQILSESRIKLSVRCEVTLCCIMLC